MILMRLPHTEVPKAADFLLEWVRPRAQILDRDPRALRETFVEMGSRGLLGLRVGNKYGGHGVEDKEFRIFQEHVARNSGILAFLQTQHQSACNFIMQSDSEDLKAFTLPALANGDNYAGIAFSQLRKTGSPVLRAWPEGDHYVVEGFAPWVTGWGIFNHCVTAATLPDGNTLFFWHELKRSHFMIPSPIMELAVFEPAQTVSIEFRNLIIPKSDVLYIRPGNWIHDSDQLNIALQAPFALGCAQAGIDIMETTYERKSISAIKTSAEALDRELQKCRSEVYSAMDDREDYIRGLKARSWAIEMSVRCAHAAIASSGGAGNSIGHPAQRVYREALVFTVLAQTEPILEATLARLVR